MVIKRVLFFSIFLILLIFNLFSQESESRKEQVSIFNEAMDLFEKKEFGSAQNLFGKLMQEESFDKQDASTVFHYAACSYYLQNNDALQLLTNFVDNFQTANDVNQARFLIGNEFFNKRMFQQVVENYEKVNTLRLANEDISQYFFNMGYSFLMLDDENKAKTNFSKIKAGKNEYAENARFYSGVISYQQGDYENAKSDFIVLKQNKKFDKQISLYLIDIEHRTGDWDAIIENGDNLINSDLTKKEKTAIAAMLIDAYFNKGDYDNTLKYIELYEQKLRGKQSRYMQYQYGFILFKKADYDKAIECLEKVTSVDDSLTQSAYNLQGYAFLKLDKKRDAQRAFYTAYKMPYHHQICEEAMFNYVKLACELSYDPYRQSFTILNDYLDKNPEGERSDEAYRYIVNLSMSTKNYPEAIAALGKIKNKSSEMMSVEQRIFYLYAINLFNTQKYQNAINWFEKAIENASDKTTVAKSTYWMAESYYRLGMLSQAAKYYKNFRTMNSAKQIPYYEQSNFNLAYIEYDQKKYSEAAKIFTKFTSSSNPSVVILRDAFTRTGDCYYVQKQYDNAIAEYNQAIKISGEEGDYAAFQKILCLGALKRYDEKIQQLNQFPQSYPKSPLIRETVYETAMTYLITNNSAQAMVYFDKVIHQYPYTQFAVKSYLRKGLILYGLNRNQEALTVLKQVVDKYPNTTESKEALKVIENIYLSMNKIDEYLDYTSTVSFANVSDAQKDSLAYFSAENFYSTSKYLEAVSAFQSYVNQFPNGIFITSARTHLADAALNTKQTEIALTQYEILAQTPIEDHLSAISQAAKIRFEKKDYQRALPHFKTWRLLVKQTTDMIEPTIGMMRCYEQLNKTDSLSMISFELLSLPNVPRNAIVEAHNNIATVSLQEGNIELAKREFQVVRSLGSGEGAAKANFYLAEILYHEKNYDAAMESSFNLINDFPDQDYWVVKSFILLSDIYLAKDNAFQAEQTLNSIIENCDNLELKNMAIEKLQYIKTLKTNEIED